MPLSAARPPWCKIPRDRLDTTGRYLARLHQGELRHHARLADFYGLEAPPPSAPPVAAAAVETGASDQVAGSARLHEVPEPQN